MVIDTYSAFRAIFAGSSPTTGADGFEILPVAKLRASGFTGLAAPNIGGFPFAMTVNSVTVDGGFAYDWWLSQRTDDKAAQVLSMKPLAKEKSGTVLIDVVPANMQLLLPGVDPSNYLLPTNLGIIMKNVHLYVSRRSDRAFQWVKLYG